MHQSPSPSALTIAAALVRGIWCGVLSRFGLGAGAFDSDDLIANWVSGIFSRLDELLAQYRAGELPPVAAPRVTAAQRDVVADRARAQIVLNFSDIGDLPGASAEAAPIKWPVVQPTAIDAPCGLPATRGRKPRSTRARIVRVHARKTTLRGWRARCLARISAKIREGDAKIRV